MIIDTIFPLMLYIYSKYYLETKLTQNYYKKKYALNPKGLILYTVCIMTIIWFNLGVFPIKPVGIASASMSPKINVGDVVFIKKCTIDEIDILDVIEYRRKDFTVIHRVVNKYEIDGKTFLITKGDNNKDEDSDAVTEEQIIGKSIGRIPYIALPTLVLNELRDQPVNVDVELGK